MNAQRLFGKYRATVINGNDPLGLGRLQVEVTAIPGLSISWAMPCVAYASPGASLSPTPPAGTPLWVEFEQGDPDYPIWSGCFWTEGQHPLLKAPR